jgi:hypothetical protein
LQCVDDKWVSIALSGVRPVPLRSIEIFAVAVPAR